MKRNFLFETTRNVEKYKGAKHTAGRAKTAKLSVSSFTIAYEVSCRARKEEVSRINFDATPLFSVPKLWFPRVILDKITSATTFQR
jgi:hypothetical protein